MTALAWDQVGERRFETGIDRGVLYLLDGSVVPWNGLVSVSESSGGEVKPYYQDGVKYLNQYTPGTFSGKLQAFTYPDALENLIGSVPYASGVFLHDQMIKPFNLSYRTLVGNDLDKVSNGYKIHLLYNILAVLSDTQFGTINDNATPEVFEWNLVGTPLILGGVYPTSHVSLHSKSMSPAQLASLEGLIYGTESTAPSFPTLASLLLL